MKIIDLLLAFGLLTTILYGLYSALLRWLHTPLSGKAGQRKRAPAESSRFAHAGAMRQDAAIHAFSR